ncbi:MAG: DUF547 domain-containing protein [Saprospiraceae bacterium]
MKKDIEITLGQDTQKSNPNKVGQNIKEINTHVKVIKDELADEELSNTKHKTTEMITSDKQADVIDHVIADVIKNEEMIIVNTEKKTQPRKHSSLDNDPLVGNDRIAGNKRDKIIKIDLTLKMDHSLFNTLCKKYIDDHGLVNYSGLKKVESQLGSYLDLLSNNVPTSLWGRDESLAYWINAYNAFTIKLILKNFPVKSIMDLEKGEPWKVQWIELGNKTYSLNNIEHDIIRPTFKEPRIHFAVNCAAKSCPPMQNEAYTAQNLENLLQKATTSFINNKKYNKIMIGQAQISPIFEWYGVDFGNLKSYLNKYSSIKLGDSATITYMEYDWLLNGE